MADCCPSNAIKIVAVDPKYAPKMSGKAISGGISPAFAEVIEMIKTVPQDCINVASTNPIQKKIRGFIEVNLLKSMICVRKSSPSFIKAKANNEKEMAMQVLLMVTTFSLLMKNVSPIAPKKSRGNVIILISKWRPIVASNASVTTVQMLDPSITAIPPVTERSPVPTNANTKTDIKLLLCVIIVEINPVTTADFAFEVNLLISFLNPVFENFSTARVR